MKASEIKAGYIAKHGKGLVDVVAVNRTPNPAMFRLTLQEQGGLEYDLVLEGNDELLAGPPIKILRDELAGEIRSRISERLLASEKRFGNNIMIGDKKNLEDNLLDELLDSLVYLWVLRRLK